MQIHNYNPGSTRFRFEWDESKNLANQRKHSVSFEEASEVFRDPLLFSLKDQIVDGEQRWQTFGMVEGMLLLMAAHIVCEEYEGGAMIEVIRIISARRPTRKEIRRYENENG